MSSFNEELKLFINRLYVSPQKIFLIKKIFLSNSYDTEEKLVEELHTHINNYKIIVKDLEEYPLWQTKFINDTSKQFAFANIQKFYPQVYELVQQQKLFK